MTIIKIIISMKPRIIIGVSKPKIQNITVANPKKWNIKHSFHLFLIYNYQSTILLLDAMIRRFKC